MAYIKIFGDGSTDPPLDRQAIIIMTHKGDITIGHFNKEKYCAEIFWIDKIPVPETLRIDIFVWIEQQYPDALVKKHPVHIICPAVFANKIKAMGTSSGRGSL